MYEDIKNSSQFYNYSMMFKYFKQSLEILKENNDYIKSYINTYQILHASIKFIFFSSI